MPVLVLVGFPAAFPLKPATAGQAAMRCQIHLMPRRSEDGVNPRGGVRDVIAGKADQIFGRGPRTLGRGESLRRWGGASIIVLHFKCARAQALRYLLFRTVKPNAQEGKYQRLDSAPRVFSHNINNKRQTTVIIPLNPQCRWR